MNDVRVGARALAVRRIGSMPSTTRRKPPRTSRNAGSMQDARPGDAGRDRGRSRMDWVREEESSTFRNFRGRERVEHEEDWQAPSRAHHRRVRNRQLFSVYTGDERWMGPRLQVISQDGSTQGV